jgi:hypothetical protein
MPIIKKHKLKRVNKYKKKASKLNKLFPKIKTKTEVNKIKTNKSWTLLAFMAQVKWYKALLKKITMFSFGAKTLENYLV